MQELRKHRRRPTKSGIVSPFSGLLYCADCGEKLYYSVTGSYKREQAYFFCSYRKNSEVCSAHYIRERVVEQITELKALIPELIHKFVDRIVVYAPRYLDSKRVQLLDIYYSGVGILHELTPEEMEEAFQRHLAQRNKEKTA